MQSAPRKEGQSTWVVVDKINSSYKWRPYLSAVVIFFFHLKNGKAFKTVSMSERRQDTHQNTKPHAPDTKNVSDEKRRE